MKTEYMTGLRKFFSWDFSSGIVILALIGYIGVVMSVEVITQFMVGNFDAGFNAVLFIFVYFFFLLNLVATTKISRLHGDVHDINDEIIRVLDKKVGEGQENIMTSMGQTERAMVMAEKFKVVAKGETARANKAEKALHDFKESLVKKELKNRKTKPVVKKAK